MRPVRLALLSSLFASALGAQTSLSPGSPTYGTQDLAYVRVSGQEFFPGDGSGYGSGPSGLGRYPVTGADMRAGLHLPGGSIVASLEVDYCSGGALDSVELDLNECGRLGANCNSISAVLVPQTLGLGCDSAQTPTTHTVDNVGESLDLTVKLHSSNPPGLRITGAIVGYRLQVSPPPGSATFNDVPTSHPFFQFVEALAASGVTAGCSASPPLYCPDAPLTRGQMAVFLSKALGLHWPNH